ncbi:MAG: IclR family transcriptional regulator [Acetobacteraceae bacterium]|nr:IclR family transcriptional regulator [Acetobacteraceae bacterium]
MASRRDPYRVGSIERAMEILKCFSVTRPELGVSEIAGRLRMPRSSAHRLLAALKRSGFLEQDGKTSRYRLSLRLFEMGSVVLNTMELPARARPVLEELQRHTGETVHLAILDEGQVLYVDKIDSSRGVRMYSQVGRRAPAHCTGLGKVLLAYLPQEEVERIIALRGLPVYTRNTIASPEALRAELEEVRRRGYAIDRGEHEDLIACAAAPIRDYTGKVIAAVSVTAIGVPWDAPAFQGYIAAAAGAADRISRAMGYGAGSTR